MASCNGIQQVVPDDVIIEILSRLPVKTLLRARVVCKSWYTIIKNPSFVTHHFNHHTNGAHLFVNREENISNKYVFSLFSDQTLGSCCTPPVYQDVVVDMPHHTGFSLYNGIMCLSNHSNRFGSNHFALWNPATREFRYLPVLPWNFPPNVVSYTEVFGFGLDPITNDYKLVWIWNTDENLDDQDDRSFHLDPYQVAVYTLSTDSWRFLDHVALPPYCGIDPSSNTCINGVYYWRASDTTLFKGFILSFDMGNESFREIRDIPSSNLFRLTPYNNYLALIVRNSASVVDIWVMMEEGCWTKQFALQLLPPQLPLGFWKNGQLFMRTDGGHVLYDPETNEIKDLEINTWAEVFVYKESLVAIRDGNGFLEQNGLSDAKQISSFSKCLRMSECVCGP